MSHGVYRGVHSSLFDDPDYQRLPADARLVLLTARQCKEAGPAVIFRYYPEVLCRQTGLSRHRLERALIVLETENWIYQDGVVLWVRNGLRHDPNLRLSDRKHLASVIRQLEGLPASALTAKFRDYYKIGRPLPGPSETSRVWPSEKEYREGEGNPLPPVAPPPAARRRRPAKPALNGHAPGAALGWASVMTAVKAGTDAPGFRDPTVAQTLERMGGFRRVAHLNNRDVREVERATLRKEFMQLYAAMTS